METAKHGKTTDQLSTQAWVIVEESSGMKSVGGILPEFAKEQPAAQAGTINEHRVRPSDALETGVVDQPVGAPQAAHQPPQRQRVHDEEASCALGRLIYDDK